MKLIKTIFLAGLLGYAGGSAAMDTGIFFGGNVGWVNLSDELGEVGAPPTVVGTATVDDSDVGWKVYFGYNFSDYFGIEVGYTDLGESDTDVVFTTPANTRTQSIVGFDGFTLAAVARWPVFDKVELIGRFGGFFWDTELDTGINVGGVNLNGDFEDQGTDITAGVGLKYQFSEHVGVTAEWDRYMDVGRFANDIDMFSFGIEFTY